MNLPNILYHTPRTATAEARKLLSTKAEKALVKKALRSEDDFTLDELKELSEESLDNISAALFQVLEQIEIMHDIVPMCHETHAKLEFLLQCYLDGLKALISIPLPFLGDFDTAHWIMESKGVEKKIEWLFRQIKNERDRRNQRIPTSPYGKHPRQAA